MNNETKTKSDAKTTPKGDRPRKLKIKTSTQTVQDHVRPTADKTVCTCTCSYW